MVYQRTVRTSTRCWSPVISSRDGIDSLLSVTEDGSFLSLYKSVKLLQLRGKRILSLKFFYCYTYTNCLQEHRLSLVWGPFPIPYLEPTCLQINGRLFPIVPKMFKCDMSNKYAVTNLPLLVLLSSRK